MYKVNVDKLDGRIKEKHYTNTSFSHDVLHISRETWRSYRTHPEKMPYSIIEIAAATLCDTPQDFMSIFFTS